MRKKFKIVSLLNELSRIVNFIFCKKNHVRVLDLAFFIPYHYNFINLLSTYIQDQIIG